MQSLAIKITEQDDLGILPDLCRCNRVVFTNGIFDILHVGHVRYLEAARNLGDLLFVAVNDDQSTRELKGPNRPVNTLLDRMTVLAGLASVSFVFPMRSPSNVCMLRTLRPSVWVKGGDYTMDRLNPAERLTAENLGIEIKLLPFTNGYSTTSTLAKITAAH